MEFPRSDSSFTSSQWYAVLGEVAKEIGKSTKVAETKHWRSLPKATTPWKKKAKISLSLWMTSGVIFSAISFVMLLMQQ